MARDANPAKRRRNRVAVSCFSCRALKTKCDNVRPVCSTCARNGRQCTWMQEGIAGGSARDAYLRSLEKRLEAIEGSRQRTESSSRRHQLGDDTAHDVSKAHDVSCPRDTVASPALQHQGPSSIVVDANVSIGTSFTQLILRSIYGRGSTTHAVTTPDEMRASNQTGVFHDDLYALPANAAAVLNRYFEHRHLLTPLFHQPSAKVMFDAALNCPPQERYKHRPAFIILNMILALCTSHWLEDRATITARKHYDIAMALLQPTILREWSLECVQALLLGARYLQTTSRGDECWNVLGLAVRIAYGLRLHQEPPSTDPIPLRETKRRIWYVAYMLDMHWSMVYERPPSARSSDFSVSLPEDLDDDCIQEHRILFPSPRQPSNMSFFLQNVKLYRIVEKEITGTATPRNTAELVVSLDNDYQEWLRERPPHLILDIENPDNEPAWILALRGNMVCILIHRQSLELSLHKQQCRSEAPKPESSMADNILRASHRICVTAAIESIDIVELRHEQTKKTAGLDWYNIYYLFNAVITLVSYILNPLYSSDRHALDKMDKALHMIKSMSRNHSFAKWAHSFLQQLTSYMHQLLVPQQESQAQTQAAQVLSHASQDHTLASNGLVSLPATTTGAPAGFPDSSADPFQLDLQTIFGHAQDLSVNLETQLESFNAGDLAADPMWMFGDGGPGV